MGAHNELSFEGLLELREALKQLPQELTTEAQVIVQAHAEDAMRQMQAAYPVRDYGRRAGRGALVRGLTIDATPMAYVYAARAVLKNRAKHAYLFEIGTEGERFTTKGASRGRMPAGKVFVPIAMRTRRRMEMVLIDLVRRAGLTVSGGEA